MEKSKEFNIIYRVCDSCENYNSKRIVGSKVSVINKSVNSIAATIKEFKLPVDFSVVFDKTSGGTKSLVENTIKQTDAKFSSYQTANPGNMESFKLSYEIAKQKKGFLFFLEDDYLLHQKCISEMYWFLTRFTDDSHICVKPHHGWQTFTERNVRNGKYIGREILLGKSLYWMRHSSSTCTFCIDDFILNKCQDLFEKTFTLNRVKEDYLNLIYKRFPLFCSIIPLGIHFHSMETFNPFFCKTCDDSIVYDSKMISPDTGV